MQEVAALASWIPLAGIALAFLSTLWVLAVWRGRAALAAPVELGRSPGQHLRDALAHAGLDAAEYAALGLFVLPLAAAGYAAWWGLSGGMPERDATLLLAAAAAALQCWVLLRLWSVLRRARHLRYGHEAELVAGQELSGLGEHGYRVFHDVPLGERMAKVDHVLVGPAGVFAVQAETRAARGGAGEREVTYDGASLRFTRRRETAPLEQAIEHAGLVHDWLTAEVGEWLPVQPVVVLPGWRVRRTDVSGIPVLAASRIRHFFGRLRPKPAMNDALIERVAACLDARCNGTPAHAAK